jgi:DNA polymerase-3 subunit alpha
LTAEFVRIFGDRFFMELQQHNPDWLNDGLIALARKHKVRPIVTSDCHYARKEDLWLEQAMLIVSSNPKPNKEFDYKKSEKMEMLERFNYAYPDRQMNFEEYELFLHSVEDHLSGQMAGRYGLDFVTECLDNTMVVADMIEDYPYYEGLDLLPRPKGDDPAELLRRKVKEGAKKRGTLGKPEYDKRREEELDIICPRFPEYFVIEANAVQWAKGKGIRIGPGRGSGAGSLVNYELGISEVDPIEHNLLFFRFINPERNDYPDIDTDVEDRRRSEVKGYLNRQYGHVASIATVGRFQGKESIRSAARALMVPLADVNRALKGADWLKNWWEEWEKTERGQEFIKKYPDCVKIAKYLFGRIRTTGMHAGGIVMSKEPINNYAPMQTAKDNSDEAGTRIPLIAVDMEEAEQIGFIKYDWLGLKALTIIEDTVHMVEKRH